MIEQFQDSLNNLVQKLQGWLDNLILGLPNFVLAAIVLTISLFAARYLKKAAKKGLSRTTSNKTVSGFLSNLIVAVFMIISIFVVLSIMNLSDALTAMLGTAGVIGLAVGLALQDPMINLFSGVLMSVRDYYKVGDLIETNGFFGRIMKINLRSTVILTPQGQEVIIPNKDVLQNPLMNYSHNGRRRIDISCGVAYGDDLETVRKIAIKAIEESDLNLAESRPIQLFFTEFGDSSINFKLRFWKNITEQSDYLEAQDKAIVALKKAFDKNGITIPFPIRTLDFGVVGGLPINEIYPPKKLGIKANGNGNHPKETSLNGN
jgi:small conductance mechanosensitive channel